MLAALPLTLAGARMLAAMSPARRTLAILFRLVLCALLAVLLAGPFSVRTTNRLAVVAVVDVSGSVRSFAGASGAARGRAIEQVRSFIAASAATRAAEDLLGVVIFDGAAVVLAQPSHADVFSKQWDQRMAEGTDIAAALRLARSTIPPDAAGRIVLFSDGNQTGGDALAAAADLGGSAKVASASRDVRIPIDTVSLSYSLEAEVAVEQVDAPPTASVSSTIPIRVLLSSGSTARGFVRLIVDGQPARLSADSDARPVELKPGLNIERFEVKLDDRRVHRFKAVFEPEMLADANGVTVPVGDTVEENNSGEAFTLCPGKGSVLLADGVGDGAEQGPGATLAGALRAAGLDVRMVPASAVPGDLLSLQEFDAVILQNVPADSVPESSQRALASYVQDVGGGLIMIGGPASFGAGGWKGSTLEPLLPVRLDLPERLLTSQAAIVFVLDNSGSMWRFVLGSSRTQQEIANDAAALAIRTLERSDQLGVITFNSELEELVPMGANTDSAATVSKVRGIMSGGGTNAVPAVEKAAEWLRSAKSKHKHLVFLSDGRSLRAEVLPGLCEQMAKDGIQVSTIGVGDDADTSIMAAMARKGGGQFRYVTDPSTLPEVFVRVVRIARTPLIREERFTPVMAGASPLLAGISEFPFLDGLSLTQPRLEPTVSTPVTTPGGEPVFAHWQVGLGQVGAFTSDAHLWSKEWLARPVYQQFWAQFVRAVARPAAASSGFIASVRSAGDSIVVRLTARAASQTSLDAISATATLYSPGEDSMSPPAEATLAPVGPGEFEATFPAASAGSYVALIKPAQGAKRLPPLISGVSINQGREYRFRASNDQIMAEISRRSGGRVLPLQRPDQAKFFDRTGVPLRESLLPLWPILIWAALAGTLIDIANRRVAWDRWVSAMFGAVTAQPATANRNVSRNIEALKVSVEERLADDAPAIALGEREARELAAQARDRRLAARITPVTPVTPAKAADSPPAATPDGGGLLAAKRRAAERFHEDERSS